MSYLPLQILNFHTINFCLVCPFSSQNVLKIIYNSTVYNLELQLTLYKFAFLLTIPIYNLLE